MEANQVANQAITSRLDQARRQSSDISELIGVCKGVLADGVVCFDEAVFMLKWFEHHTEVKKVWPAEPLYGALNDFLEDGILDEKEESQLIDILEAITGSAVEVEYRDGSINPQNPAVALPYTHPEKISHETRNFVLAGTFSTGNRGQCERLVERLGGNVQKAPSKNTHYLIVGGVGCEKWLQSSFGRKIEKAVLLREAGCNIEIVSEQDWVASCRA